MKTKQKTKKLDALDLLNKHWHILPWHFKVKIFLICEFYSIPGRVKAFFAGVWRQILDRLFPFEIESS